MSGDRLAQIEERVRTRAVRTGNNWAPLSNADVLALVEIAKAAREAAHPLTRDGYAAPFMYHPANEALRSALARLDSGATKENT